MGPITEPGARYVARTGERGPDLPGYGWSGPPPHRWAKEEIVSDALALLDALALERVLLLGHDWGGYVGHLLVLRAPERVRGYLALNMPRPWQTPRTLVPHLWRFLLYQPALAAFGARLMEPTRLVERVVLLPRVTDPTANLGRGRALVRRPLPRSGVRPCGDRHPPYVLVARDPGEARHPEQRRSTVRTRTLFGTDDVATHPSLAAESTARADDYRLGLVPGCGHFIAEERRALIRERLETLALKRSRLPAAGSFRGVR